MAIYLKNIDLSKNQLLNATLHPTGTAPATPATGQVYFDTSAAPQKGLWYYDGTVWAPVRVDGGIGLDLAGSAAAPVYDLDFTASSLSAVTTNTSADIFAMYDDSVGGMRGITFGNLESNLTIANMIGGGSVGTVTSVTAGAGMTQTGTSTINPTLNVIGGTGITANADNIELDYLGADNFINSATNLEGTSISTGDTIIYHDATDDNIKKGFVSDLPFTNTLGTVTNVTSTTTDQLTVANGTTTPALTVVTAAVTNGGTALATGDQIYDFVIGLGYSTTTGTVTTVSVGTGLDVTSASTTPNITLSLDELSEKTGAVAGTDRIVGLTGTTHWAETINQIPISVFNNDANYSSTTGTVTSVSAGNGMSFSTITGTGSVTLGTPGSITGSSTNSVSASSHTHALSAASTDLTDTADIVYNDQANTYTGTSSKQTFIASTTGSASIRLQSGVDPTTPVTGDLWMQSDNLKYRDSSATRTIAYAGGAFHDGFSDFVGNEHINHDNITITLNQTANETSVTGAGQKITGNVTFTVGIADNAIMPGTGGMIPVAGTTAQRVTRTGNFRYNTTDNIVEWYNGSSWDRPDVGGGEVNQNAFSIVTGDSGTAAADAKSDTIAITGATGLTTTATAGASAALEIDYDIANVGAVTSVGADFILLGDSSASQGIAKTTITNFISNNGIALLSSPTFTGNPTAPTPPENDNDTSIATTAFVKLAVDSALNGNDTKESVVAASTADLTGITYNSTGGASGRGQITTAPNTLDGVTLAADDRILLKDQSPGAENGIWVVTTVGTGSNGVWDRATDFDEDDEVTTGAFVYVEEGTANATSGWRLTTENPITIGGASGTALTFTQVSGAGQITAGDGLTKTGNTLDVNVGTGIAIVSDEVRIDTAWTGQSAITTVGTLTSGTIGAGFTAITDNRLATITTANKVSGSAVQLAGTSAIENSTGLRLKSSLAGTGLTMASQVLSVDASTTTSPGAIETATVTESQTATDSSRAVTPEGLGDYTRSFTKTSTLGATTTVTHNLGHRNVQVEVFRSTTPWDTVYPDITRPTTNTVEVTFTPTATAGEYTIVVTGAANAATTG